MCTCQKQSSIGVVVKKCSENMQQIYWRTNVPKYDFNNVALNFIEVTLWHGCSPVNLLHIFRTAFRKNTYGGLLLTYFKTDTEWKRGYSFWKNGSFVYGELNETVEATTSSYSATDDLLWYIYSVLLWLRIIRISSQGVQFMNFPSQIFF